ncbi:MAG: NAD(P)/FAD-dependent oxidoreductase, partial [Mesorhizobium sp.]
RLLTAFPEKLSQSAKSQLEKLGVEVKLGAAVTECDDNGVALADGQRVASACVLWAAGVMASRAAKWLDVAADRAGRVVVDEHLHVPGREG